MKDQFRDHIGKNRAEADIFQTDADGLWEEIEGKLVHEQKRVPWMKIAASLLLIATFGWLGLQYYSSQEQPSEFAEAEFYYNGLISEKMDVINANRSSIDPVILQDLESIDQALTELKTDLKDNANNQEVVEAMIKNYRVKLYLLEEILNELEQTSEEEDEIIM